MRTDQDAVEVKIKELKHQTQSYLSEFRKRVEALNISQSVNVISYFTSSLIISHDPQQESLCMGSYHIYNIGYQPLINPYVCIKLPEDSPFSFSGQYVYEHFKQNLKGAAGWERINDKANKVEFLLKPLGKTSIEPNEIISFSNFQIKWAHSTSYAGSITGVTYCDQLQDGMAVINPINLNGFSLIQEGEHE
ncbi:hypothetical protein ACIQ2D_11805 [Lysinibacillus sp. NPDC097287]|uniref:hypothetical protein n=1 Tax=Lysinibacillus sp. NPDC097287 TaxID=3364144 RepID=UPI0038131EE4